MSAPIDLAEFRSGVEAVGLDGLKAGLIGRDATVRGPWGPKPLIYADFVASGRALAQVEDFVRDALLPLYANSHTEASYVGGAMTALRRDAREVVRAACNASAAHAVIFSGSGATQGLNRLVHLFGLPDLAASGAQPLVLIGPYEHHSNILPWRESGAEIVEVPERAEGGPDVVALDEILAQAAGRPIFAAFSAASNVTGVETDVAAVTRRLKAAGATVVWDYAGGGPYLPIDMRPAADAEIDAVAVSPHKFLGGPQASGVLIVRRDAVRAGRPTLTGGGTVKFVSPSAHDYAASLEAREEAGTPNVIGDVRAALCFLIKAAVGEDVIAARHRAHVAQALAAWRSHPRIELLGDGDRPRLPIFSFRVRDGRGGFVHHQLFTRMLSDHYGVQARGGCACAGPYVHRLLGIDSAASERLRAAILAGDELAKPGFVRLNFSYLAGADEVAYILDAVSDLADRATDLSTRYAADPATAIFRPI